MKSNKKTLFITLLILAPIFIYLFAINFKSDTFFDADFMQIITFLLASVISLFVIQHHNDVQRKADYIISVISDIELTIQNDKNIFSLNKEALLLQSSIANRLKFIEKKGFSEINQDIAYISSEFSELRQLYGNHSSSEAALQNISSDLKAQSQILWDDGFLI